MDTREKVFAYIREHHMLQAGMAEGSTYRHCRSACGSRHSRGGRRRCAVCGAALRGERNPFFPDQGRGKEQSPHGENL